MQAVIAEKSFRVTSGPASRSITGPAGRRPRRRPGERVAAFTNRRGTARQHIMEGENAINRGRLARHGLRENREAPSASGLLLGIRGGTLPAAPVHDGKCGANALRAIPSSATGGSHPGNLE